MSKSKRRKTSSPSPPSNQGQTGPGGDTELSIEETNKLRISLGLKPLDTNPVSSSVVVVPPTQPPSKPVTPQPTKPLWSNAAYSSLYDDEDDLNPANWVLKQRKKDSEKILLSQQGVISESRNGRQESTRGPIVYSDSEDEDKPGPGAISSKIGKTSSRTAVHVSHDISDLQEGQNIVLTLADVPMLDERGDLRDEDAILENIELVERDKRNKIMKDKQKTTVYNPIEELEGVFDPTTGKWESKEKEILPHYDEWKEGAKPKPLKEGFNIQLQTWEDDEINLNTFTHKKTFTHTLNTQPIKPQDIKIRKVKKSKQSLRKNESINWDDILGGKVDDQDEQTNSQHQSTHMHTEKPSSTHQSPYISELTHPVQSQAPAPVTSFDETDENEEFYELLSRQKRRNVQITKPTFDPTQTPLINSEQPDEKMEMKSEILKNEDSGLTLTSTTEFCKTVQTPMEKVEAIKHESYTGSILYRQQKMNKDRKADEHRKPKWQLDEDEMEIDDEALEKEEYEVNPEEVEFLHENNMDNGLASAIGYLKQKGDLSEEALKKEEAAKAERRKISDDIKLEYRDANGRLLNQKEAFQYISWIFHGKGPGKAKSQSRMKKMEIEKRLKDNPLESLPTIQALKHQQKTSNTPYLVLSGQSNNSQ